MQKDLSEHLEGARNGNNNDIYYIFSSLKPAISILANKFKTSYFDFEDAVQEGNIGLFKAILTYEKNKNANFQTYAKKCILNSILTARTKQERLKHKVLSQANSLEDEHLTVNPEKDYIIKEQNKEFIKIAKQKLSSFEFLVFSLYTMQYSYKEIAKMTKKDEKSINNAIQRIHNKLRK